MVADYQNVLYFKIIYRDEKTPHDTAKGMCNNRTGVSYDFKGKRILVVEDIEINRVIISELLTPLGIVIEEAENGKIAVDMFKSAPSGHYNLIFMDIQMPVMDGHEATRAIRALDKAFAVSTPIIAMSANAYSDDIERSIQSGMNGHIAKPIDFDDCVRKLKKFCAGK